MLARQGLAPLTSIKTARPGGAYARAMKRLILTIVLILAATRAQAAGDDTLGKKWLLSLGGKLYDNLFVMLDIPPPKGRNPLYPAGAAIAAADTWRCVACHGWDYKGREGHLKKLLNSPRFTSLRGVAGRPQDEIVPLFTGGSHAIYGRLLPPPMQQALAFFLSRGQHDVARLIDGKGRARGERLVGKDIYEGTCISCHEADGKAYIQGEAGDRPALGWVARHRPEQALHKIRNGVPGADMLSLRFLSMEQIAGILAYLQSLDPRAPQGGTQPD